MHNFTTHQQCTVLRVLHPESSPLPSPFIPSCPPPRNIAEGLALWSVASWAPHHRPIGDIRIPVVQRASGRFTWSLSQYTGDSNLALPVSEGSPHGAEHGLPCRTTPNRSVSLLPNVTTCSKASEICPASHSPVSSNHSSHLLHTSGCQLLNYVPDMS